MVALEPRFAEVWEEIADFIGINTIIAHNASFDLSVLRATLTASGLAWPEYSYACTMVMSRKMFDLTSHGLSYVAHKIGIPWDEEKHHDALYDSQICADIAVSMGRLRDQLNLPELLDSLGVSMGKLNQDSWQTCRSTHYQANILGQNRVKLSAQEIEINTDADASHPLYGRKVVLTGALHSMSRNDAWTEIAKVGAIPTENVTKETNVVVVGQQELSKLKPGQKQSKKFLKAKKLKTQGQDIEVIDERDFLAYIEPVQGSKS